MEGLQEIMELHWRTRSQQSALWRAWTSIGLVSWQKGGWTFEGPVVRLAGRPPKLRSGSRLGLGQLRALEGLFLHLRHSLRGFGRREGAGKMQIFPNQVFKEYLIFALPRQSFTIAPVNSLIKEISYIFQ